MRHQLRPEGAYIALYTGYGAAADAEEELRRRETHGGLIKRGVEGVLVALMELFHLLRRE